MDESEKRKERLRAMRVEAEETEASHNVTTSAVPGYLSNPLAEDTTAIPVLEEPCAPFRFDFYSDPMAAFSSDNKRIKVGDQIAQDNFRHSNTGGFPGARLPSPLSGGPRNPQMTASPAHQFQRIYPPDQRMYQVLGSYQNFSPQRSPIGMERPFPMHHGNRPEVWNGAEFRPPASPGYGPQGSPRFRPQGSPGFRPPGSPRFQPPGSPGFRPPTSPGFRPPGSPGSIIGQGRGHWFSHTPRPQSVHGGSPSPSSSSGRGGWRGSHGRAMDRQSGPERFYNASMVEDPWKFLEPVIWKGVDTPLRCLNTHGSSKPSIGRSSSTNNASISEALNKSMPQPSLAEFLAASLNEAVNDAPST
ncbi:hypothetical protein ACFX13_044935 [Malus domestica]